PLVFQYNKRDLPNALPIEILNERLNPRSVPFYEAVALKGQGVEETLKGVTGLVFKSLASKYGDAPAAPAPKPMPQAAPPPPPPPAAPKPPAAPRPPPTRPPAAAADELLDSLELQPTPDAEDEPIVHEELDLPPALSADAAIDEIEPLPVEMDELGM